MYALLWEADLCCIPCRLMQEKRGSTAIRSKQCQRFQGCSFVAGSLHMIAGDQLRVSLDGLLDYDEEVSPMHTCDI